MRITEELNAFVVFDKLFGDVVQLEKLRMAAIEFLKYSLNPSLSSWILSQGEVPPVKGFWSLTLYDAVLFFHPNPLNRYSLGTKNKTLKYDSDGSLTLLCRGHIAWQGQGKQLAAGT